MSAIATKSYKYGELSKSYTMGRYRGYRVRNSMTWGRVVTVRYPFSLNGGTYEGITPRDCTIASQLRRIFWARRKRLTEAERAAWWENYYAIKALNEGRRNQGT